MQCCRLWERGEPEKDSALADLEICDLATAYKTLRDDESFAKLLMAIDQACVLGNNRLITVLEFNLVEDEEDQAYAKGSSSL